MNALAKLRLRSAVVLVATLLGVWGTAKLGLWQLSRAAQKEALQSALDSRSAMPALAMADLATTAAAAEAQHYRRIALHGHWLASATVFLDNRQMNERTGFFVVTPLLPADGSAAVLVQRGFVARDNDDRTRLPALPDAAGEVTIAGHIAPPPARLYEFAAASSGPIRQNLHRDEFSREIGLRLRPLSIVQEAPTDGIADKLLRQWPRPAVDVQKHYGYAFQWFALCALMAGLYVWFQLLRPRFGDRLVVRNRGTA